MNTKNSISKRSEIFCLLLFLHTLSPILAQTPTTENPAENDVNQSQEQPNRESEKAEQLIAAKEYFSIMNEVFEIIIATKKSRKKLQAVMAELSEASEKLRKANDQYLSKIEPVFTACFSGYDKKELKQHLLPIFLRTQKLVLKATETTAILVKRYGIRVDQNSSYVEIANNLTNEISRMAELYSNSDNNCK